jgi:BirA family transcriptional regulator, biotin operon repressor / biotin---[acetyl-CoA-carboxylase] ligase
MYQRLFIGNNLVSLEEVASTNVYLKSRISESEAEVEGLVIVAKNQYAGRGQRGNEWESEKGKNLTFSIFLKPNILVKHQFLISKVVSLGIIDFLEDLKISTPKIKWPNDIYCDDNKIAGILIENSIKENKIYSSVVGVGLNVNQIQFNSGDNPTSLNIELNNTFDIEELLYQLLFFIERRYLLLKASNESLIDSDYLHYLYKMNQPNRFKVKGKEITGVIIGVSLIGKLQVKINENIEEFDLKEIEFL